jgi:hypothetical protein
MTTPEGEGAQSGAEGTQSGAGETTGTGGSTTDTTGTTAQSGGENGSQAATDTVSRSELDAVLARMRAADQRASKAETDLRQLRDKDLPEADKLKRDFEESQGTVTKLQDANRELTLKVAFLEDNTHTWHDPKTALKLVDLGQIEIDGDGNVRGLKDALKALATSHPYLIKQEVKEESKPQGGTAPGNNGQSGTSKTGSKGMAARIPALNTRVRRS